MKRARAGSISGRLRSASDLEEKGLIDKSQKGVLKDLIISGDEELQAALDLYESGDPSRLTTLMQNGLLDKPDSLDLLADLDIGFLSVDLRDNPKDSEVGIFGDDMSALASSVTSIGNSAGTAHEFIKGSTPGTSGAFGFLQQPPPSQVHHPPLQSSGLRNSSAEASVQPTPLPTPPTTAPSTSAAAAAASSTTTTATTTASAVTPDLTSLHHCGATGEGNAKVKQEPAAERTGSPANPALVPDGTDVVFDLGDMDFDATFESQYDHGMAQELEGVDMKHHHDHHDRSRGNSMGGDELMGMQNVGFSPSFSPQFQFAFTPDDSSNLDFGVGLKDELRDLEDFRADKKKPPAPEPTESVQIQQPAAARYQKPKASAVPEENQYVGAYSPESRKKRIERFLEKRSRRVWTKTVKYDVRKNFADTRMRVKGRFVKKEDEALLRELMALT
ncbi:unnamed protein product [Chrysoparadoxa australica]